MTKWHDLTSGITRETLALPLSVTRPATALWRQACQRTCWSHVNQSGLLCKCRVFENSWGPHLRYGLLLIIGGVAWCGVRLTDACSSWYRGGLSPGWNIGPHTPPLCWPPSPCLMSHELPVCLLLPAVSALPLPGQSLKHMLLRSAEQPDRQAQPNCYKEQSCHFLFLPFFLLGCSSKRGMGCSVIKLPFQMLCLTSPIWLPRETSARLKPLTNT